MTSMLDSRAEVDLLVELLGMTGKVTIANGAARAIADKHTPADSEGAQLIIRECRKPGHLSIIFLGPLTDMASALLLDPTIAANPDVTVVWVGGDPYDGVNAMGLGYEYNLSNDVHAANVVLQSGVQVQQIPWTVYSLVNVGYAELEERVAPYGPIGHYLVSQLKDLHRAEESWETEVHTLGDSPAVGVVLRPSGARWRHHIVHHFEEPGRMTTRAVPHRTVAVADFVDVRFLLEDMYAKIKAHHAKNE